MATVTYLQLYIEHCSAEALVNDIAVLRRNEKNIVTLSCPIHEYLVSGENTLGINIKPYEGVEFDSAAKVHLRVANFQEGDNLGFSDGDLLSEITFSLDQFAKDTKKTFFSQITRFMHTSPHVWVWQNAGVLALNDAVIASLNKFVASVHQDFQNKVVAGIVPLVRYRNIELATCYPMASAGVRDQETAEYVVDQKPDRVRKLVPLKVENLAYRLGANGRLVECIGRDGLPLIRTEPENIDAPYHDENYVALPMHVGFVDNSFCILR